MGVGEEEWELLLNGYRVSVWEDEKHSKDCVHNNVNIFSTAELYTQK